MAGQHLRIELRRRSRGMVDTGSIISALGGGSGIDMTRLAADLASAQFTLRQDRLAARYDKLEQQISAASSIRNALSTLASSLGDRVRTGDLAVSARIANPSVAEATIAAGNAPSGSYTLEVTNLAKGQALVSPVMAAETPPGEGTLTIRFGTVASDGFTADAQKPPLDLAVGANDTLADIASNINRAGAGLTAYVAQTAQGAQLVVKGEEGARSGFVIETAPLNQGGPLAGLAWSPETGDPARLTQQAADAHFLLDGVAMTSASNTTGAIGPGLSLRLTGTNAGQPTTIGFSDPSANVPQLMGDLVNALNEVVGQLREATLPDGGELATDPGARMLKTRLARLAGETVMPAAEQGAPRTLADLGLKLERDGSFSFDADRLAVAVSRDAAGVAAMFTTGIHGVYASIDKLARGTARAGDPGSLGGSLARFAAVSKTIADQRETLTGKQEALRAQLLGRLVRADARVISSRSTLSFLQAQIDSWNAGRG